MCRLGLAKRQQCQDRSCNNYNSIAFNKCWDCPPERFQKTKAPPRPPVVRGKRTDIITQIPPWIQHFKHQEGVRVVEHRRAWELTLPHSPILNLEGGDARSDGSKTAPTSTGLIAGGRETEREHKPKKYITPDEFFEKPKPEREALEQQYEVFLI